MNNSFRKKYTFFSITERIGRIQFFGVKIKTHFVYEDFVGVQNIHTISLNLMFDGPNCRQFSNQ